MTGRSSRRLAALAEVHKAQAGALCVGYCNECDELVDIEPERDVPERGRLRWPTTWITLPHDKCTPGRVVP